MDQDHIQGGITFFSENGESGKATVIEIGEVWHNSYRHLGVADSEGKLDENQRLQVQRQSRYLEKDDEASSSTVSGKQGTRLGALLYQHGYRWNQSFGGKAVGFGTEPVKIGEVTITVLSPTQAQLVALRKRWKKELTSIFSDIPLTEDEVFDDAVEFLSHYMKPKGIPNAAKKVSGVSSLKALAESEFAEDPDEINGSSITFILEYRGMKVLFLGDAPPTLIEQQLREVFPEDEFPIHFDAVKVSHHGSKNNTSRELLACIDSPHYFVSTDGKIHGHPDPEALARIVVRETNEAVLMRNLYMTYPTTGAKAVDRDDWKKEFAYELVVPESEKSVVITLEKTE
nr:MBL fold metallo-hydrolase [Brevibacillus dissolubilis]